MGTRSNLSDQDRTYCITTAGKQVNLKSTMAKCKHKTNGNCNTSSNFKLQDSTVCH